MSTKLVSLRDDEEILGSIEEIIDSTSSKDNFKEFLNKMQESVTISINFLIWVDTLSLQKVLKRWILPIFRIDLDDAMVSVFLFFDLEMFIDIKLTF